MSTRRAMATLLVLLALCWGGTGYAATRPTDAHDYRRAAIEAARSAYDVTVTVRLVGSARAAGRLPLPYTVATLNDGRSALAGAAQRLVVARPVDDATARIRDRLGPLLLAAAAGLDDLRRAVRAPDLAALTGAVAALAPVGTALAAFLAEYG
ncbi:hypothetical protein [Micromonospora cathayae]|uniref:DUF4439 domain-containing protein n=1 Tax=Micromonospora cathayae TaxID=3028804 RepID=A0ABY7ZIE6_9ACTN|nr:hypothetical protein [Micromonospora sp. HUAS 3]WDZ82760.1 hypothetical protein PVK37_20055 [Micromonospora sp. HUAS 3]